MAALEPPFISPDTKLQELTLRGVVLSIGLAMLLAMSNAYLALKAGILTSASIPAAVISMGILRFFRNSNILENNLVQTAASAGEAVAGGIVYTIPALIMINYWTHFPYWQNVCIAAIGGLIGVLFSIPMRRVLVTEPTLRFPEGRAIAEVLKTSVSSAVHLRYVVAGGLLGAGLELCQTGFKVLASTWQVWFVAKRTLFGFGAGFSAAMIGAGYLIGFNIALSIFIGALIGWLFGVPLLTDMQMFNPEATSPTVMVMSLWESKLSYVGIGAMLAAGVWTFVTLLRPFTQSIHTSIRAMSDSHWAATHIVRTEKDLSMRSVLIGLFLMGVALWYFLDNFLPVEAMGLTGSQPFSLVMGVFVYILVVGFIFSAITGYFSGLVGVTASPGSSIIIAGILMIAMLLLSFLKSLEGAYIAPEHILAAEAMTIIAGSIITGIACIANDNIQDLKVGHILGATPWRQQVMLMLGVLSSAIVIPPVMQLLFDVYGIAGVMPRPDMDPTHTLPAPPAALMAAITSAVFHQNLPWNYFFTGVGLIAMVILINHIALKKLPLKLSVLGIAIGIYLPLASSIPIFMGGLIAYITEKRLALKRLDANDVHQRKSRGVLIACGLVAGAALMDVLLAIPFSLLHSPNALRLVGDTWHTMAVVLTICSTALLGLYMYRTVNQED